MPIALPLTDTVAPADAAELAAIVAAAHAAGNPVYPIGGGTALEVGLPPKTPGLGLSLAKLDRLIDYPARDMTITVDAGMTLAELTRTLAAEKQELPIDAPQADRATIGGLIATNWSGPRRYGHGTIRDYVIGISAVDGCGRPFKGGGRVAKNVAGYDFCRMLVGSLGTLGVITQVTLKVKPRPEAACYLTCGLTSWDDVDALLAGIVQSRTTPSAVELLVGGDWFADVPSKSVGRLVVGLEGTAAEVRWMQTTLAEEWQSLGATAPRVVEKEDAAALHERLTQWPAASQGQLLLKGTMRPSTLTRFIQTALAIDPRAAIQAHAGNGIVLVCFAELPAGGVTRDLIGRLYPIATADGGHCTILRAEAGVEITRQSMFAASDLPIDLLRSVKQQFDPGDTLNRGRFVY